jgi:hypothetical protein
MRRGYATGRAEQKACEKGAEGTLQANAREVTQKEGMQEVQV